MNLKRTVTIGFAGGALVVWLVAAANSRNHDSAEPIIVKAPPIDSRGAALASEIARLHERLRPNATLPKAGRDLFSFVPHGARTAAPVQIPQPASVDVPATRPVAAPPPKLSGIAEDATADGPVRTAIISFVGQLFLVKEGERVTARYRVLRVSSDVVELADLREGSTLRLALR